MTPRRTKTLTKSIKYLSYFGYHHLVCFETTSCFKMNQNMLEIKIAHHRIGKHVAYNIALRTSLGLIFFFLSKQLNLKIDLSYAFSIVQSKFRINILNGFWRLVRRRNNKISSMRYNLITELLTLYFFIKGVCRLNTFADYLQSSWVHRVSWI